MKTLRLLAVTAALALVMGACGDDDGTATTAATTTLPGTTTTAGTGTTGATTTTAGTATTAATTTTSATAGPLEVTVVAKATAYDVAEITAKAGQEIHVIFDNQDTGADEGHNIHFRTTTADYFTGIHIAPDTQELRFTVDTPGTYSFFCDTHSTVMVGVFTVTP